MWLLLLIVPAWIIIARKFPHFSMSNRKAMRLFQEDGIQLHRKIMVSNGHPIHYVWTGRDDGPVIVFVHGSPQSWTFFKNYLRDKQLVRNYKLVALDRPGFGQSEFGKFQRLGEQANILSTIIGDMGKDRPLILVGHSYGGPLVVQIAAMIEVSTLIIVSGCLDPKEEHPTTWMKILSLPPFRWFLPGALRTSNDELIHLKEDLQKLNPAFSKIKCPVILIHGTNDKYVSFSNMQWAEKKFVHASRVEAVPVEGAGHFIPVKNYKQLRKLIVKVG